MRIKALLLSGAIALLPLAAGAEVLTLNAAYQRMISGELEFEILQLEQDVAKEFVTQARGALRPRVNLRLETHSNGQNIVSSDNTSYARGSSSYLTRNVSLTLLQPMYDAARFRQIPVAEAQKDLVRLKAEQARNELVGEMADRFLNVAVAQYVMRRAEAMISARSRFNEMLLQQSNAGRVEMGTTLRAEGELLAAETERSVAELEFSEALFELARFAGASVTGVSLADNRLGVADSQSLRRSLTAQNLNEFNPGIQIARAEKALALRTQSVVKAGRTPVVNLEAEMAYDSTEGSLFGGGSDVRSNRLGIAVDLPIYQGGTQVSREREEALRVRIAERRLELATRIAQSQYEALIAADGRAASRVSALIKQRNGALEAREVALSEEAAGRIGAEVALERELSASLLEIEIQAARVQQMRIQMRLYALFGALDVNSLSRQISG